MKLWKKILLGLIAFLVVAAAAFVILPRVLFADRTDYGSVVSIESAPEYQDAAKLEAAWALPVASTYKSGLDFQANPSFCGPTSVVNVLRSWGNASDQKTVLNGSSLRTVFGVLPGGLTLDELADLVKLRTGKQVTVLRDLDLETFRQHLRASNDPAVRYILNFSRGPLFARGGGHHSPIGGYLENEDLVFVLDVNAKFKPWLVKSERLFQAIDTVDRQAKKKRGLLLIR